MQSETKRAESQHAQSQRPKPQHADTTLSDAEFIRYSRSLMLGDDGDRQQLRLKHARVLLLGLGGLGCPVATTLVGAGIGQLTIIDGDNVELSNLPRQSLYQTGDIGKAKAEVAAARLRLQNPHPLLSVLTCRPDDQQLRQAIADCDVVVDCSDNLPTRLQLNTLARQAGKPLFAGAVSGTSAQLYLLSPATACYQCLVDPNWQALQNCRTLGVDPALVALTAQQLALLLLNYLRADAAKSDTEVPFGHYGRYQAWHSQTCHPGNSAVSGFHWYPLLADPHCGCCAHFPPLLNATGV